MKQWLRSTELLIKNRELPAFFSLRTFPSIKPSWMFVIHYRLINTSVTGNMHRRHQWISTYKCYRYFHISIQLSVIFVPALQQHPCSFWTLMMEIREWYSKIKDLTWLSWLFTHRLMSNRGIQSISGEYFLIERCDSFTSRSVILTLYHFFLNSYLNFLN